MGIEPRSSPILLYSFLVCFFVGFPSSLWIPMKATLADPVCLLIVNGAGLPILLRRRDLTLGDSILLSVETGSLL